jgi:hypothetical protein
MPDKRVWRSTICSLLSGRDFDLTKALSLFTLMRLNKVKYYEKKNTRSETMQKLIQFVKDAVAGVKERHVAGKKGNSSLHGGRGPCDAASHDLPWRY